MKDILYEFFIEPFTDGLGGILFGLMWWAIFGLLGFLFLCGVDGLFLPTQEGKGVVIDKEFIPQHEEIIDNHIYYYDDEWKIRIIVDGKCDDFSLKQAVYDKIKIGAVLPIVYSHGRLWKTVYVKQIYY